MIKREKDYRARGPEFFKQYWKTKKGHWELIKPNFDDIHGWKCWLTVKCLDCGHEFTRQAGVWLVTNNEFGCKNCDNIRAVTKYVTLIESKGFDVLTMSIKHQERIYKVKCRKCGEDFQKGTENMGSWLSSGAKCPVCRGKSYPPNVMKIRRLHYRAGFTYMELSKRAHYSRNFVISLACGDKGAEETVKYLADVAEEMAKEKSNDDDLD